MSHFNVLPALGFFWFKETETERPCGECRRGYGCCPHSSVVFISSTPLFSREMRKKMEIFFLKENLVW